MTTAVVLLSGGIDSATALAVALQENDAVHCVSFQYGSRHNRVEANAARRIVEHYELKGARITHEVVELPFIFFGAGSALMAEGDMPELTYQQIAESEGPSPTVVPFRNANLLSMATTIAVVRSMDFVYCGMHAEDARGWAYPDCSPEFLGAMANAIFIGTYNKVRLVFPFVWSMKSDIVGRAIALDVPVHLTWSCYAPIFDGPGDEVEPSACGKCPTCIERIEAFKTNLLIDPAPYAVNVDWGECDKWLLQ